MNYLEQGYYACLLAHSNKDTIIPTVETLNSISHFEETPLSNLINSREHKALNALNTNLLAIKIFFGIANLQGTEKIAKRIFEKYPTPILEVTLEKQNSLWKIKTIKIGHISSLNDNEQTIFANALNNFSSKVWRKRKIKKNYSYDLGIYTDLITKDDYMSLLEYDGLFIITTTSINHYSYSFSKKAEDNNLVVIDDTKSITCCTNKVYLHNLMIKNKILTQEGKLIFKDDSFAAEELISELGLPIVLKIPDSSFSKGVKKANSAEELKQILDIMLEQSSIIIAQKYYYTDFDWRTGILNNKPIYACKYFMAKGHWQITNHNKKTTQHGNSEAFAIHQVDKSVLRIALKAAKTIGNGLYGIDIKVVDNKPIIIEINDNPSLDSDIEDTYIGDQLYTTIMLEFLNRMNYKKLPYANI
ncbi:RimK family alpha-L-glutamate ligase [Francisella orientalis]|nr:RimK family alpha-L-glutamate ligase [Francisella orientalis]AFJ42691.1 glutathione synthase/ribosomal protein S6 modification enzyme [Francisella orientalis str. Toba 04]AHB97836.1 glutathione synthase [Francisella orientalis LADL 07-285A]AKN84934.1 Glutathione synthase/ribosomal protein S6 d [Francisella orientalis FNO12]AKN86472.1 Glutathione synthase/ribosomal protein S6 d [Francisella orientalis FNO24]AKN88010.1 Glutathione synthase/ribosomal protein S6 d [Francisella orientalis]